MTQVTTKKAFVSGEEGFGFRAMEIAENLFEVLPFGTAYIPAYLLRPEPRRPQDFGLMLGNVVIEENHAAVFVFGRTSRAMPRSLKAIASRIASTETKP